MNWADFAVGFCVGSVVMAGAICWCLQCLADSICDGDEDS